MNKTATTLMVGHRLFVVDRELRVRAETRLTIYKVLIVLGLLIVAVWGVLTLTRNNDPDAARILLNTLRVEAAQAEASYQSSNEHVRRAERELRETQDVRVKLITYLGQTESSDFIKETEEELKEKLNKAKILHQQITMGRNTSLSNRAWVERKVYIDYDRFNRHVNRCLDKNWSDVENFVSDRIVFCLRERLSS